MTARFAAMSSAEYRVWVCNQWTEAQFQTEIITVADQLGWMYYHTHNSKHSPSGWPDLVLLHPVRRKLIIWELKSRKGKATLAQIAWINGLRSVGINAAVKWPVDWADESIQRELRGVPA